MVALVILPLNSCKNDEENENPVNGSLSGEWAFEINPDSSFQDTSVVEGTLAGDFGESGSSYQQIFLYEDEEGNIYGEMWGYKLSGKRNINEVELDLFAYPDGPLDESVPVGSMKPYAKMKLTINQFGLMNGHGDYYEDEDQPWTSVDSYFIHARKLNDISNPYLKTSFKEIICDLASGFTSFLISNLTYGTFRPMATCYGHKDGGGFYVFGHEGPGSILPIYTITFYVAWEWSWCKVRSYSFNIDLKGESIGYESLKALINSMEPELEVLKKLGFAEFDVFSTLLDEFHQKYGGFAFTAAFNTHTHNMSLYVNHTQGSSSDIKDEPLVKTMRDGLDGLCHDISVYAGSSINDKFQMRRSDIGVCNSDIIFVYLFGTNSVNYD